MKNLTFFTAKSRLKILEIGTDLKISQKLKIIGLIPEKVIVIISNPTGNSPLIIQIDESRFAISKNIASNIFVEEILL